MARPEVHYVDAPVIGGTAYARFRTRRRDYTMLRIADERGVAYPVYQVSSPRIPPVGQTADLLTIDGFGDYDISTTIYVGVVIDPSTQPQRLTFRFSNSALVENVEAVRPISGWVATSVSVLDEMRSYLRNWSEHDDLPDELLDDWLRMAHRRVQSEADWRWLYETRKVTVARTGDITEGTKLHGVAAVLGVVDENERSRELSFISWQEAYQRWSDPSRYGRASHYIAISDSSDLNNASVTLRVFPPAEEDIDCFVRVKIVTHDWPDPYNDTVLAPPQLPMPFYDLVKTYALADVMQREGEPDDARATMARYHQQVALLRQQYVSPIVGDLQVGGGAETRFRTYVAA